MKNILLLVVLFVSCVIANGQVVKSGSIASLKGYTRSDIVFDYSKTEVKKSVSDAATLISENGEDWGRKRRRQEEWCIGSINDDLKGAIVFGMGAKADLKVTICVNDIDVDLDNPQVSIVFTDKSGNEILVLEQIKDDDLNGVGHIIGTFLRKQLRKLK